MDKQKSTAMAIDKAPEELSRLQKGFAAHIRDPESAVAPEGIEDRRMGIYRDLFFNNIRNFLSTNFPVLRTLFDDKGWETLCRDFYSEFRCHTPLFPEIPREFLRYLQDQRKANPDDPPFMLELAHYEWVELALSLDEAEYDETGLDTEGDMMNGIPVLSPLAWPLSYQYPVHRIREDYQPESAPENPSHLLVWRQQDFSIKFMQLNEISMLLLQKMKEEPSRTGLELLTELAADMKHPEPAVVLKGGSDLLDEFRSKQIILGTLP